MSSRRADTRAEEIFDLLRDQKAKPSSRILFQELGLLSSKYANKNGEFFRSVRDLVADSGLSAHSVINGLRELKEIGLIDYRRGGPEDFAEAKNRGKRPGHIITISR
jgi:hypothetical protein